MMDRDLSRTTVESFLRSIASLRRTDLIPLISQIKVPTMGMYGDKDVIVHPLQWQPLQKGIPHAVIERFPTAGHFPMLEEPTVIQPKIKNIPRSRHTLLDEQRNLLLSPKNGKDHSARHGGGDGHQQGGCCTSSLPLLKISFKNYLQAKRRSLLSHLKSVSLLQRMLEQEYGPHGGRGIGFAYRSRMFQVWSQRIWFHAWVD